MPEVRIDPLTGFKTIVAAERASRPGMQTFKLEPNLQIDGRPVADLVQGHSYSTWLPAGPHILTVRKVPTVGYSEPTWTTVNIQSGADYLYVAVWDSGLVYLHPAGVSVTPGAHWQFHGDGTP